MLLGKERKNNHFWALVAERAQSDSDYLHLPLYVASLSDDMNAEFSSPDALLVRGEEIVNNAGIESRFPDIPLVAALLLRHKDNYDMAQVERARRIFKEGLAVEASSCRRLAFTQERSFLQRAILFLYSEHIKLMAASI